MSTTGKPARQRRRKTSDIPPAPLPVSVNRANTAMMLQAVASALGLTRERIRQIETKALLKLRVELERRGLSPADLLRDVGPELGSALRRVNRSE